MFIVVSFSTEAENCHDCNQVFLFLNDLSKALFCDSRLIYLIVFRNKRISKNNDIRKRLKINKSGNKSGT